MTCKEARKYCQTYHTDLSTISGEEDVQMHPFFCYENLNLALEKKTWEEALEYCRSHETDLAYVDPKVLPNMSNAQTDSVWTGLRFLAGMWFWVSKENVETSIALPSCPPEPYRCGARNAKTGNWENRDCEENLLKLLRFIF
uniref:C-type lectin domain-containing protein n=1 Tax=Sinocyclocheilus anshuiensis TaxID=1608454 RepID=A0A671NKI5_9TELE